MMAEAGRGQYMQNFIDLFEDVDPCSKSNNDLLTEGFKGMG